MVDMECAMANIRGTLIENEKMSQHTTWRLGGPADIYFCPSDIEDLAEFLKHYPDMQKIFIGLGSNLLVRDGGIRGAVINLTNKIAAIEKKSEDTLYIESGAPSAKVARVSRQMGFVGLEFLAGIPGTMGGALAMNAGAHGAETWDFVESVILINNKGDIYSRNKDEFITSYRTVKGLLQGEWFLAAIMKLDKGDEAVSKAEVRSLLDYRNTTQPTKLPNAGSVFKNPQGHFAAKLIENCGLKGVCIGGACVSDKHANFIVNQNNAKAQDVEMLIEQIKRVVLEQCSIELKTEVRIIGEQE